MEEDLDGVGVSSHDHELSDTTVQALGRLVGTLLDLFVVNSLLDDVQNLRERRG